ncbi:MAG: agmatine deiminase family protein [Bryobacterales bacterium]|nr:agmatine deiminase family protein [Bryobacterales bacterium]
MNARLRMPAEWEPHEATWLAWPHEKSDWPGKFAPVPWVYGEFVRYVSQVEKVRILVQDEKARAEATKALKKCGANMKAVEFFLCPTDRSWTRDFCPIFVKTDAGEVRITNWKFNGWAKYPNHKLDNAAPAFVARRLKMPQEKIDVVLEGGSIDVNGRGTMLTTEECLLSDVQARNPKMSRDDLEACFALYLGVRKVLWLNRGIAGDDTHGHVDDLARFVDPTTVVTVVEQDKQEENYEPLQENLRLLKGMTDQDGNKLKVVPLPMPRPVWFDGQRLPASYANFYIANGLVLAPTFNDPNDRLALNTLAKVLPDHRVVGIHCVDLVLGLGTLHCMTQQQPA